MPAPVQITAPTSPLGALSARDWTKILLSTLAISVSVIPVAGLTISVFLEPLSECFGWQRSVTSGTVAAVMLALAVAMPLSGAVVDRFGLWRPCLISLVGYAACLIAIPFLTERFGLPGIYAGLAASGFLGAASSQLIYTKFLSAEFSQNRGFALGLAMCGIALGGAVAPMLANMAIEQGGWQRGYYALSMLPLGIGVPIVLYLRVLTESRAKDQTIRVKAIESVGLRDALRSRVFLTLFVIFFVAALTIHGVQIHLVALISSDFGLERSLSVVLVSMSYMVSIVARIGAGYLFDRFFPPYVGAVCFFATACGIAAFALPEAVFWIVLLSVALVGIGTGAESDLLAIVVGRYFGLDSFGKIYGALFAAFMLGSAVGPIAFGFAYDMNGNYASAVIGSAFALAATSVALIFLPKTNEIRAVQYS